MAGAQQSGQEWTSFLLVGMVAGAILSFWLLTYSTTGAALIRLKQMELYPMTFISEQARVDYNTLATALEVKVPQISSASGMWRAFVVAGTMSGKYYRYPIAFILGFFLIYVMFFRKKQIFKNKYGLESVMAEHAKRWPVITPLLKFNPAKGKQRSIGAAVPVDLPPFAEALYPEEWMAHNRIAVVNGVPDRDQIRRAFLPQLCERFEGLDGLPEHLYCLAAALALKGARKRKECDALLGEMAKCWTSERGFVPTAVVKSTAAHALRNPKYAEPLLEIMNKHAYVATAFLGALKWARRQGGVLAPAQFIWLRAEDRTIWYPLNNLDRRAFHIEASGAMSHYMAEVYAGRPLTVPRLEAAVVAVTQYLSENRPRLPGIDENKVGGAAVVRLPENG